MDSHHLLAENFFMNLLREDAGVPSTQLAVLSAIMVSSYLIVLLALWFII